MRRGPLRRGLTPLGCMGIGVGVLAIVAGLAAFSGWVFDSKYRPALIMARDEIQPVGERFIRNLSQESFQPAYAALTEACQKDWPPEKFADLGSEIANNFGSLQRLNVDVTQTVADIVHDEDRYFDKLPMSFPCVFEKGIATFHLMFRLVESEDGRPANREWKISGLSFETAESKKG